MAITFYATNNFTGDGTTVNWNINFADGYIDTTNVKARYLDNTGSYVDIAISRVAGNVVTISPAVANGQEFQIYRDTEKRFPLVDFSDGAILNETNLDTLATQAVMVSAEAFDQSNNGVRIAGDSLVVAQGIDAKAQLALDNSDAAVATANAIDGKAQTALDSSAAAVATANAAASTAAGAVTTANTALATANDAAGDAATAITTANGAVTTANAATTTANAASVASAAATTTANNAANNAAAAVSTAGTALSTANTASTSASTAVATANDAKATAEGIEAKADSALAASATAVSTANSTEATANAAKNTADGIAATANQALTNSNTAITTANRAEAAAARAENAVAVLDGAVIYDKDYPTIAEAFDRANVTGSALILTASRTIRIPTDAPSLQAVVNICSRLKTSVYLTVMLESGFKFTEETLVEKRDCSWITIQSVDSVVTASLSFSGVNLLHVVNSFGPIWDILVDVAGSTVGNGLYVRRNSDIEVRPSKGVINAKNTAITALPCGIVIVESSRGHIPSSNFSGNYRNLWVSKSSVCNAEGGNFDNATGDFATYIVRNSLCHLSLATVNNAAHNAVYANNSRITFLEGEAINADTALYAEFAGVIYTRPRDGNVTNISGSRINAISASNGSVIIAEGMTISPASGFGITARDGGKVSAVGTSVLSTGTALNVYNEGEVHIAGAGNVISSSSASVTVVRAYQGGRINLDGAVVTGGSSGLLAESGGTIHARGVNMSGQAANTIQAAGGYVNADNSVLSKSSANVDIVYARRGGVINANSSAITGGRIGAHADAGGRVCVNNSTINGASTGGVRATGGEVNAQAATVQNNTGKDLAVYSGGILRAGGSTTTNSSAAGTPNPSDASVAFNTFGASGFIFA